MSAPVTPPPANPGRASTERLEQAGASDASITAIHQQLLREKPEPVEGFSPIPIFLLFIFSGLIFIGGIYIARFSGEFSPFAFDPSQGLPKQETGPQKAVDPMVYGARLYAQQCIACHQANGQGLAGSFPPLDESEYATGSEDRLIRIVLNGLSGPIQVKGATYNGAMPAFGQNGLKWNETRIAAVLTYVRGSWNNKAPPITPEKVKEVMGTVSGRSNAWTVGELEQFK